MHIGLVRGSTSRERNGTEWNLLLRHGILGPTTAAYLDSHISVVSGESRNYLVWRWRVGKTHLAEPQVIKNERQACSLHDLSFDFRKQVLK